MGLRNLVSKESKHDEEARKAAKPLAKEFPWVAEVLGGLAANGDEPAVAPGTITIFFHDGRWRFSANVKSQEKTFIGDIADIVNLWQSINFAFAEGGVSSKRYSVQAKPFPINGEIPH